MLSLFPELLFLAPLGALIVRLSLAFLLALSAWKHVGDTGSVRVLGMAEAAVAALLVGGAWTQPASLGALFVIATWLSFPRMSEYSRSTALLALAISISLILTGPGAFAFDLPL
jgi:hypothetical protein